jgi:hypothetical protein
MVGRWPADDVMVHGHGAPVFVSLSSLVSDIEHKMDTKLLAGDTGLPRGNDDFGAKSIEGKATWK